jgi:hypothetical protein
VPAIVVVGVARRVVVRRHGAGGRGAAGAGARRQGRDADPRPVLAEVLRQVEAVQAAVGRGDQPRRPSRGRTGRAARRRWPRAWPARCGPWRRWASPAAGSPGWPSG